MKSGTDMSLRKSKSLFLVPVGLLLVTSALIYLPNLLQATVYRDDWYYVLDRLIGGPGVFQAMFSIDRPARGPFFELYYLLFGIHPLPYHIASYIWRFLSGLASLWLFHQLWPDQRRATLTMALLFVLYPGYLRWMEGIEDQPRIASACFQALSFALTIKAIGSTRRLTRIAAWIGSILTGWAYLALLDFGIGMEVFRFLCVFIFVEQGGTQGSIWKRGLAALRAWAPAALIPFGFLFWRLFIFHNERPQTDVGRQLGVLVSSPFATAATWLIRTIQSAADVLIFSWTTPALQSFFNLRLKGMLIGGFLAALAVVAVCAAYLLMRQPAGPQPDDPEPERWKLQAIWSGLIGVAVGVLPVIAANRYVDFQSYSHYALPASLAGSMFMTGLVFSLRPPAIRLPALAALVACAAFAHNAYSSSVLDEEKTIAAFWQQVAWRAPEIQPRTTLFVNYPGVDYGDNVDAVNGPADIIYFPQQTDEIPATYQIMSLPQSPKTTTNIMVGRDAPTGYRTHVGTFDYERLLVLTQPSPSACVHVLDGQWPLYSKDDPDQIRAVGAYSKIDGIVNSSRQPKLAEFMFGPEPAHRWCYYFEKADLALQSQDWKTVAQLGKQAAAAGLHPEDWVEWTPFLQAYAMLGDETEFTATAHRLNGDAFARIQACSILTRMQAGGQAFSPQIQSQMDNLLCRGE
ncbi:MAG TPA: hypothetical protein VMJ64_06255 [Anaerolineales bacterium]|nr:hypothetical protein [Anaerolineales bacterium]